MATKIPGKQIEINNILLGGNNQHIKVNGNLDLLGNEIFTNTLPTNKYSYVNKEYVDSIAAGFDPKESCRLATTSDILLTGIQFIDDIEVNNGDRILVKNQIDPTKNGIYIASYGSWLRSKDMDSNPIIEVSKGNFTFIETGTTNYSSSWVSTSNVSGSTILIDIDDMIWVKFNSKADLTADDNAITINNNIIQLKIKDGTLTQDINGLYISTAYTFNLNNSITNNSNNISSLSSYTYNTLTSNFNSYTGLTNENINELSGYTYSLNITGLTNDLNTLSSYTYNTLTPNFNSYTGLTNENINELSGYTYSLNITGLTNDLNTLSSYTYSIILSGGTNVISGSGLSFNGSILNINLSGDSLSIVNNRLKSSVLYSQTGFTNLSGLTGSINTGILLNYKPAGDSFFLIYLNGISYPISYGNTTGVFYFSNSGLLREDIDINSELYFNATNAYFLLEYDDLITISYNAII